MAQWVTCLLHKHKEVNLDPPNLCKKLGVGAATTIGEGHKYLDS